jgi:ferredoxin
MIVCRCRRMIDRHQNDEYGAMQTVQNSIAVGMENMQPQRMPAGEFGRLLAALSERGYRIVGPRVRDGAIVYDELAGAQDLPVGWTDRQSPGRYRLERRGDAALFGYNVGPQAWKKYLFPPRETLWRARREESADAGFIAEASPEPVRRAFIGVRACELQAIAIQDRVFTGGNAVDPRYAARRSAIFTVAVNCGQAAGSCFCVSMGGGPRATRGYDLALTELLDDRRHDLLVEAGSAAGEEVLAALGLPPASEQDGAQAAALLAATAASMGRTMETADLKPLLYRNAGSPHWETVAQRCVSCGNCTSVCPTCFCSDVEDVTSLDGNTAERVRSWTSCFTQGFTHLPGGAARASTASRYRHWITHKLAGWQDQFGTSGCVGCGRCITWCPPGIDITAEIAALREKETPP